MYEYLTWTVLLGVAWLVFFVSQRNIRRKILWSSVIAAPFSIGELYYIPNYWAPQTLFNLGIRFSLDIEAFLLMFFLGGLAGAIYETVIKNQRKAKQHTCRPTCTCYLGLLITLVTFLVLIKITSWNIIYPSSIAALAGGIFAFSLYKNLRAHILLGGVLFMLLYLISLAIMNVLFPSWILTTWNMNTLSNILILGVPIEELFFGFAFGTLWTSLYEEICSNFKIR